MTNEQPHGGPVIQKDLTEAALILRIEELGLRPEQIIAITEPERGSFTLIYVGTPEQYARYRADVTAASGEGIKEQADYGSVMGQKVELPNVAPDRSHRR